MTEFDKWYNDYSLCRDDEHITRWSMEKAFEAGAQSERDKHRWIPVTERLPEDGILVLAKFHQNEEYKEHYEIVQQFNKNWYNMIMEHPFSESEPIAWQPLPEA
jgi:hypothetical protein